MITPFKDGELLTAQRLNDAFATMPEMEVGSYRYANATISSGQKVGWYPQTFTRSHDRAPDIVIISPMTDPGVSGAAADYSASGFKFCLRNTTNGSFYAPWVKWLAIWL